MATSDATDYRIKSYVLRASRMRDSQKRGYEVFGPAFLIPPAGAADAPALSSVSVFGNDHPLVVEIGFGMGDATLQIARENPGTNYIGIEVHRPGVGKLLAGIGGAGITNLRIIEGDAATVIPARFSDASLAGIHVFFPDPWPKKRHHKRRLVQRPFMDVLAGKLAPGGYLYFVTDWAEYADWSLKVLAGVPGLSNPFPGFAPHREWRPLTKFERKGAQAGRPSWELFFVK